ncbi:hypothetical protein ACIQUB_13940 [Rhizobium sp. NPDC090275]|uniref:hypothetical protein n=1 Tax=Rhizobium sp. NPDC090275 TaxID=3364498 RepID=UPI000DDD5AD5
MPTWIQTFQALLTPVVAVAVAVIAFLQWRTAHQKVVLDLFDRRLAFFDDVMELHRDYMRSATPTTKIKTIARALGRMERKARFLFGEEVVAAINELATTMWEVLPHLIRAEKETDPSKATEITAAARSIESRINDWHKRFPDLCLPYMRMDQKQIRTPAQWFEDRNRIRLSYADEKQR